ncbi:hypothetical protein GALMADRAFT_252776 [Galerina marginata CBS 339.88]|uniref:ubiquitinyl hydrolase 1 n=1 Tax=Galerina marginata (strain CBS 339.88) TaxID=685588 RepID=A0A067SRF4_GALM3|nr:hypothetical protein GALMADRAFT_252776 [Galerina marginata CBS 339.88]
MAKSKAPTPQEIYRERKQREEREKTAYLPPGLINHGNTCFMNSVLQGLIATRLLNDLVHFSPIPLEVQRTAATPIISRRSPQLTNGHNLAGPYEQPWVNSLPIGDMFLTVMYKAWDSQALRRRDYLSPRSLLGALGQKYDQYLDFAQQDAHEFLRILLDAMRMEEQDIIKKRQPPLPPHHKKRRRTTITPANVRHPQPPTSDQSAATPSATSTPAHTPQPNGHADIRNVNEKANETTDAASASEPAPLSEHDEPPLLSFVDMIFGGQLTSILVCQKCKHVSQTYEDFNDISLSIKAEDYYPHRKRDRFKKIVGRLTTFPGSSSSSNTGSGSQQQQWKDPLKMAAAQLRAAPPLHAVEMQRSSSVPPSPHVEGRQLHDEPPVVEPRRRRSLDVVRAEDVESAPESSPEIPGEVPAAIAEAGLAESSLPGVVVVVDGDRTGNGGLRVKGAELEQEDDAVLESDHSHLIVNVTGPDDKHVEFVESKTGRRERQEGSASSAAESEDDGGGGVTKEKEGKDTKDKEKEKSKEKPSKSDDSWAKIGRRISLTVGLGWPKDKEKKERDRKSRSMDRSGNGLGGPINEAVSETEVEGGVAMQKSLSAGASNTTLSERDPGPGKNRVSSDGGPRSSLTTITTSNSQSSSSNAVSSTSAVPSTPQKSLPPQPTPSSTAIPTSNNINISAPQPQKPPPTTHLLSTPSHASNSLFPHVQRSKSPKPPKPSAAETEYLRKILADVSTSAPSNNPFAIFKPPLLHSHSHPAVPTPTSTGSPSSAVDKEKGAGALWLGMGIRNFSGLEECLRMFTAVEVLDGENMVGCRRCWKIQNGVYHASSKSKQEDSDQEDEEEDEERRVPLDISPTVSQKPKQPPPAPQVAASSSVSSAASGSVHLPTSISMPTVYSNANADTNSARSVSSLIEVPSENLDLLKDDEETGKSLAGLGNGPGGMPIPVISTTAPPDTPSAWSTASTHSQTPSAELIVSVGEDARRSREAAYARLVGKNGKEDGAPLLPTDITGPPVTHPRVTRALNGYNASSSPSGSKDSLLIPQTGRPRYQKSKSYSDTPTTTTDNDSSGDDSDTSVGTSFSADSAASSSAVRNVAVDQPQQKSISMTNGNGSKPAQGLAASSSTPSASTPKLQTPAQSQSSSAPLPTPKKPSKPPKPVIMRPAYKRYLIATPPPVLVIHLKRFQQTSKTPLMMSMSFSHGFKKLDDYVSFPEHLDLAPFLAPRKEDYGLGRKDKGKERDREKKVKVHSKEDRCMYRLYAVVVHIGNMLGGHYVAYTAIPAESPVPMRFRPAPATPNPKPSDENTATPNSAPETGGEKENIAPTPKADHAQSQAQSQTPPKPTERQWAYISDTTVRLTTLEEVLHAKAYICMYERC